MYQAKSSTENEHRREHILTLSHFLIYNDDCGQGNSRFEVWDFEADRPADVGGMAYFDAMQLARKRRATVDLGRPGFAVSFANKVTTIWADNFLRILNFTRRSS